MIEPGVPEVAPALSVADVKFAAPVALSSIVPPLPVAPALTSTVAPVPTLRFWPAVILTLPPFEAAPLPFAVMFAVASRLALPPAAIVTVPAFWLAAPSAEIWPPILASPAVVMSILPLLAMIFAPCSSPCVLTL